MLAYESFTAFALEASFFGVLAFGRSRVPAWLYLFSTMMVALGKKAKIAAQCGLKPATGIAGELAH